MRFAGDMFEAPMSESRRSYEGLIDKPVVPGFNTEDLMHTPELPAGTPFNQNDKGRYIQQNPGSGIASLNDSFGLVGQIAKGNAKNSFGLVGQLLG